MKRKIFKIIVLIAIMLFPMNVLANAESYFNQQGMCLDLKSKHNINCINLLSRWTSIMKNIEGEGYNSKKDNIYEAINKGYQMFDMESSNISINLEKISSLLENYGKGGDLDVNATINDLKTRVDSFYIKWDEYLKNIENNGTVENFSVNGEKQKKTIGHENVGGKVWQNGEYIEQSNDVISPINEGEQNTFSGSNVYTPDKNSLSYQDTLKKQSKDASKIREKRKKNKMKNR